MKSSLEPKQMEAWNSKFNELVKKMKSYTGDDFWKYKTEGDAIMGMIWILKKLKKTPEIVASLNWVETTQRPDYFQRLNKWREEYNQAQIEWEEMSRVEKIKEGKERDAAVERFLAGPSS